MPSVQRVGGMVRIAMHGFAIEMWWHYHQLISITTSQQWN